MLKSFLNRTTGSIVLGIIITLVFLNFVKIKNFIESYEALKFVADLVYYSAPFLSAFFIYLYQTKKDTESKSKLALSASLFLLREQFDSSINMFCTIVDNAIKADKFHIRKFNHNIGTLERIDKKLLCSIDKIDIESIQNILILEEKLIRIYSDMDNLNALIDKIDTPDEKKLNSIHSELIENIKKLTEIVISDTEFFITVFTAITKELSKRGVDIQVDITGTHQVIAKAKSIQKILNIAHFRPPKNLMKSQEFHIVESSDGRLLLISGSEIMGVLKFPTSIEDYSGLTKELTLKFGPASVMAFNSYLAQRFIHETQQLVEKRHNQETQTNETAESSAMPSTSVSAQPPAPSEQEH
ncbi:hypothetical protein [Oleidesulfovibrio alaskensis]|uniref:hypothetical protein n=1 Tax=Oleidesulfovibrio alaskensis TaxID=58180 RepID=UPI000423336D|nr:hypothetical protein [Oleidesulfovibrio alaskensis]